MLFPNVTESEILTQIDQAARIFKAYALVAAYDTMADLVLNSLRTNPEFARVSDYSALAEQHFRLYFQQHINYMAETVFDESKFATKASLSEWQEAGYPLVRKKTNYFSRVRKWKAIYDNSAYSFTVLGTNGRPKTVVKDRARDAAGNIITYEHVIQQRNGNFSDTVEKMPYLYVLNYGNSSSTPGYPTYRGIFFVEKSKRIVAALLSRALAQFEKYCALVVEKALVGAKIPKPYTWLQPRVRHNIKVLSGLKSYVDAVAGV